MARIFAALLILSASGSVFASATESGSKLSYKDAKAECVKEKPDLKGKALRGCIKEKQLAAKGQTSPDPAK